MDIVKKHLTNGQYLTQEFEKKSQFLHHTESTNFMSAWRWWNSTPGRVGTQFIIGRDGSIIECFDPKMWAFHLGVKDDDNWHEKHSINVELVSAGHLHYHNKEFRFYPLWPNKLRYTHIPKDEVYVSDNAWRGQHYWHKYTDDQLESLKWLIGRNTLDFPSLEIDNDLDLIFDYDKDIITDHKSGIFTHASVREDKKDVFPYPPLIEALKEVQGELLNIRKATQIPEVKIVGKKPKTTKKRTSNPKS